ncbi:DUF2087 domain-containing protein [Salinibius halmophilus]|uniref:DUF2087 domain-containing protein n=1 Tax=Salinibius halmophilus TaxID=1853216 RepID=UPI0013144459|nr:DUF2087 domain-containing protein [Salinibius halmophilus]
MSKQNTSLLIEDLSQAAKYLANHWPDEKPSHVQILNLLAKAAGKQNFQHAKAQQPNIAEPVSKATSRQLRQYHGNGKPNRWPTKRSDQLAMMWMIYLQLPKFTDIDEKQVNEHIKAAIQFSDYVLVRRELVSAGLLGRTNDGRQYWLIEAPLPSAYHELAKALSS